MTEAAQNNQSAEDRSARHYQKIAAELGIGRAQVVATAGLLGEGGTVPFISRYRKEATGSLDEVAIMAIRDRLDQLADDTYARWQHTPHKTKREKFAVALQKLDQ